MTTYYIDPTGSDTDAGGINDPWATLDHALDNVSASDIIICNDGTYTTNTSKTLASPTTLDNITIKAASGATPIFTGGFYIAGDAAGLFDGWVLIGLTFANRTDGNGCQFASDNAAITNLTISSCKFYGNGADATAGNSGLGMGATGKLLKCEFYNNAEHGVYVQADDVRVLGCLAYNNGRGGIRAYGNRLHIQNCKAWNNGQDEVARGGGILISSQLNSRLANIRLLWNHLGVEPDDSNISLDDDNDVNHTVQNARIMYNNMYNTITTNYNVRLDQSVGTHDFDDTTTEHKQYGNITRGGALEWQTI